MPGPNSPSRQPWIPGAQNQLPPATPDWPAPTSGLLFDPTLSADENPLSDGGLFTGPIFVGDGQPKVLSGLIVPGASSNGESIWAAQFTADQEVWAEVARVPATVGKGFELYLRVTNANTVNASGYSAYYQKGLGYQMYRHDAGGASTQLGATVSQTELSDGDALWFQATGLLLTFFVRRANVWEPVIVYDTTNDATILNTAGNVGLNLLFDARSAFDSVNGGSLVAAGVTYEKTGSVIIDTASLAGADEFTSTESGSIASQAVAVGSNEFTVNKTGAIISEAKASGADVFLPSETGAIQSEAKTLGPDVYNANETGAIKSEAKALGPDVFNANETGKVISEAVPSGADALTTNETGAVKSSAVAAGVDAATYNRTGAVISEAKASGADVFADAETGKVVSEAKTSGADVFNANESGAVISAAAASGSDSFTATEKGAVVSGANVSGAGAETFVESGAVISDADLSGAESQTATESGAIISDADLSGFATTLAGHVYVKTGAIVSACSTTGADVYTASETGSVVSEAKTAGGDAVTFVVAGALVGPWVLSGSSGEPIPPPPPPTPGAGGIGGSGFPREWMERLLALNNGDRATATTIIAKPSLTDEDVAVLVMLGLLG